MDVGFFSIGMVLRGTINRCYDGHPDPKLYKMYWLLCRLEDEENQ